MQRLRQGVANAGDRANQVGARTQVSHFAQILDTVAFRRHRIAVGIFHPAHDFQAGRLNLKRLALTR